MVHVTLYARAALSGDRERLRVEKSRGKRDKDGHSVLKLNCCAH